MKLKRSDFTRQFYKGNRLNLFLSLLSAVMGAACNLLLSWLVIQLMDLAAGQNTQFTLNQLLLVGAGIVLLIVALYLLEIYAVPRFMSRAMTQYKNFVFRELSRKNISAFSGENSSVYISALSNDANTIENDYLAALPGTLTLMLQFVGALVMMIVYSPMMTLFSLLLTLIPVLAAIFAGDRLASAESKVSEKNASFVSTLRDSLSGFSVVKSFKAEEAVCGLFQQSVQSAEAAKASKRKIASFLDMMGTVGGFLAQMGVFALGAFLAITGRGVSAGMVMGFTQLMNFVLSPIEKLPKFLASRKAAFALVDQLAETLSTNIRQEGQMVDKYLDTTIDLKDVSFGYTPEKTVLHGISFSFQSGKSYALVGSSGSGKSTLLNLLMAGHSSYSGEIRYDDVELRDIHTDSLYEMISIIQQNVFVFNNTIRNNITMFRDFPQEEVDKAIELSGLTQLIRDKGEGYLCGENGSSLSGGEKQRISIARSLLRKSSVLLVDEATAALDAKTANQVASAILDLEGYTRIVVTHSMDEAVLKQYDCILSLKNGTICESGSFEELMDRKGFFYSLFTVSQTD